MALSKKRRVLYIFAGVCMSLVILELALRLLGSGYKLIYRLPQDKGADYRIFCVGEPSTMGVGAADPRKQSYPRQLESMLNSRFPGRKIQCFFDHTIGQNTSEILIKLPSYIQKYRPDLVILMTGVNNWWNMDKCNIFLFNKDKRVSDLALRTRVFMDQFRVWKLFKWLQLSLGFYKEKWNIGWPEALDNRRLVQDGMDKLEKKYGNGIWRICNRLAGYDISEMIRICQANHIRVMICSYPGGAKGRLAEVQGKMAEKYGVPFVDNESYFKSLSNAGAYFYSDGWHPNEKGYALVAGNIYDCIIDNKLIE
ncbi:MAG TPA: hypothetical protein DCL35_01880 [Candidatus Omnitrophica bacterium]|nr:hypothetical protein [Candidatus Omnitrophota bacterium]